MRYLHIQTPFTGEVTCPKLICGEPGICQGTVLDAVEANSETQCQVTRAKQLITLDNINFIDLAVLVFKYLRMRLLHIQSNRSLLPQILRLQLNISKFLLGMHKWATCMFGP